MPLIGRNSGGLQLAFTLLKVLIILAFVIAAIVLVDTPQPVEFFPQRGDFKRAHFWGVRRIANLCELCVCGWNAATYLVAKWRIRSERCRAYC